MRIVAGELALESQRTATSRTESSERLRAWRGERPNFEAMEAAGSGSVIARISAAARQALAAAVPPQPTFKDCPEADAIDAAREAVDNDPFIVLIRRMLEMLTGEEVRVFDMQEFSAEVRQLEVRASAAATTAQANGSRPGWGMEYDYHAVQEEYEQTSFSASGTIRTADGQEIRFSLSLEMTRSFREETHVSLRAGDAVRKDPLVINFGGTAAQLAARDEQRFRFDLDGDGRSEQLPLFASGSGYLALDLNANGRIDSGRELFGPQSNNGFAELARLDADGNGWIDANDAAFERLRVWTPAAEGDGKLRALAELGIGALGLAHVATPFALRGDANADLGAVKASGLYLDASGKAGSMQEIDLTV
jgi:hypothetical protein